MGQQGLDLHASGRNQRRPADKQDVANLAGGHIPVADAPFDYGRDPVQKGSRKTFKVVPRDGLVDHDGADAGAFQDTVHRAHRVLRQPVLDRPDLLEQGVAVHRILQQFETELLPVQDLLRQSQVEIIPTQVEVTVDGHLRKAVAVAHQNGDVERATTPVDDEQRFADRETDDAREGQRRRGRFVEQRFQDGQSRRGCAASSVAARWASAK